MNGRRWTDFEVGNRGRHTLARLYRRLPDAELYRSDWLKVYGSVLSAARHVVGIGGAVNRNEGLHSFLRGKLNRLVRRTKGYSKTEGALQDGLRLVWMRHGLI